MLEQTPNYVPLIVFGGVVIVGILIFIITFNIRRMTRR
jgi:hypothetical protein